MLITDPDDLTQDQEVIIDTAARTVELIHFSDDPTSNIDDHGVTLKALYSFLKEEWKTDTDLIKFPFPMTPITDEQFEFVNDWDLEGVDSENLVRTAGWAVRHANGNALKMFAGVISLGALREVDTDSDGSGRNGITIDVVAAARTFTRGSGSFVTDGFAPGQRVTFAGFTNAGNNGDKIVESVSPTVITITDGTGLVNESGSGNERANASTRVYYAQSASTTAATTPVVILGRVNQAVQILRDDDADLNFAEGSDYDRRTYLKLYAREWGDTYAASALDDIGVTALTYQAYRFPLTTTSDVKIPAAFVLEENVPTTLDDLEITWLAGVGFTPWLNATVYPADSVVSSATDGHWFYTAAGGTSNGDDSDLAGGSDAGITWVSYGGEREIGDDLWFPFSIVIDVDTGEVGTGPGGADPVKTAEEIYTFIQYSLRLSADIDAGSGTRNGNVTDLLLNFVGDNLFTRFVVSGLILGGTFIDQFSLTDINRISFRDSTDVARVFPFTATLTINFGANLQTDADGTYWVFFTNDDAGDDAGQDYGTPDAILVEDADAVDMTGSTFGVPFAQRSYAYDTNVQRGAGSEETNAPITAVAIGLETGQFVTATGTIERSNANAVSLVAALERNYANPA